MELSHLRALHELLMHYAAPSDWTASQLTAFLEGELEGRLRDFLAENETGLSSSYPLWRLGWWLVGKEGSTRLDALAATLELTRRAIEEAQKRREIIAIAKGQ
jgi:hypothetical protein